MGSRFEEQFKNFEMNNLKPLMLIYNSCKTIRKAGSFFFFSLIKAICQNGLQFWNCIFESSRNLFQFKKTKKITVFSGYEFQIYNSKFKFEKKKLIIKKLKN